MTLSRLCVSVDDIVWCQVVIKNMFSIQKSTTRLESECHRHTRKTTNINYREPERKTKNRYPKKNKKGKKREEGRHWRNICALDVQNWRSSHRAGELILSVMVVVCIDTRDREKTVKINRPPEPNSYIYSGRVVDRKHFWNDFVSSFSSKKNRQKSEKNRYK